MKKSFLSMLAVLAALQLSYAQWTNGTTNINNTNTGNIGIGTTSPSQKLHVKAATSGAALLVESATGGGYVNIDILGDRTVGNLGGFRARRSGDAANFFEINPQADRSAVFFNFGDGASNPATKIAFTSIGKVGIGTASPTSALHINTSNDFLTLNRPSTSTFVGVAYTTGGVNKWFAGLREMGTDRYSIYNFTNTAEYITVLENGNVGIGIPTPDQKLSVKGTIHSQRVLVDNLGWSDYVFKPDYKLPDLSEVRKYIAEKQHLPDIPSEEELNKTGVDVHEMLKLQMKKIEELTLYLIEQDKRNQTLGQQVADLSRRLQNYTSKTTN